MAHFIARLAQSKRFCNGDFNVTMLGQIIGLISYAQERLELNARDTEYKANRLLEIMQSGLEGAELEDAVYGELSLLPSEIDERFSTIFKESGSKAATEWLYNYCVANKYVKKDVLDKNPRFDTENGLTITINKAQLEDGLERASLLARMDKNNLVKFDIRDKVLTLTSASNIGNVTENITISLEGKDLQIAFNARYLSDCMHTISDEFIKINFTSSIAPCTICSADDDKYLYLILPVRIVE